jgi:hypothetical protein
MEKIIIFRRFFGLPMSVTYSDTPSGILFHAKASAPAPRRINSDSCKQ